jgi:hypothetical protein
LIASFAAAVSAFAMSAAFAAPAKPPFHSLAPIPAPDGRWDFTSWDAEHGRVLVAHGQDVLIFDPAGSVRAIGKLAGAHGVLAVPGSNTVIVSSGKDDSLRVLDAISGNELAKIAVVGDPDAMILSADGHTVYVMGADSGAISIVDLVSYSEKGRINLKAGLEVPVLISPTLLAVNNEPQGEIELADLATGKAAGVIAIPGCKAPTGLAYAPQQGLALSACANGVAAIVDMKARALVKLLPIGMGPDTAIWQESEHRFLVSCGRSGTLSIISLNGNEAKVEPAVTTQISARTAALDPASSKVYLPAASFGAEVAGSRAPMIQGSFHLLVLAPQ